MNKKTLNEHLFEQLERISEADAENIDLEISKTNAMIGIADEILSVARLKIDIIQSGTLQNFSEIDIVKSETKQINNVIEDDWKDDSMEEEKVELYNPEEPAY